MNPGNLLFGFLGLGLTILPVLVLVAVFLRLGRLGRRVEALEEELKALRAGAVAPFAPAATPAPAAMPVFPSPVAPSALVAQAAEPPLAPPVSPAWATAPPPAPPAPPARPAVLPQPLPTPAANAHESMQGDADRMEQLIGGVWLQNLGAVLLLLGVFLMIVWGYSTGRFGPGVLVAAGVVLGLAFAWRGESVSRTMPPFGHALIGTGLGIVYLTLYLGFVQFHVLGAASALVLLALVSFGSIAAGLRHRVQLIAALGVIGAFLPQFMTAWLGLGGFHMTPWQLFGYIAVVDLLVFALTARVGWSRLDMTAVVLGALAWISAFHHNEWGWGVQLALAGLYTLLGLAPLPTLVRAEGRLRPMDLAVITVTPLAFLAVSAPFIGWASSDLVAMLLFALAAAQLGAAAWVDRQRPERDAWVPLTGAATLYFTMALERALSPKTTPIAWCLEGVLLLAMGLRPRAGSLRVYGHLVLLAGALWALTQFFTEGWSPGMPPLVHAAGLRALGATLTLLAASAVLARGRARLVPVENVAPEGWAALGNVMLMAWFGIEAGHLASRFVDPQPGVHGMPPPVGMSLAERREALATSLRSIVWMAQATVLVWRGTQSGRGFLRGIGYFVAIVSVLTMTLWTAACEGWYDQPPVIHVTALLELAAIGLAFAMAALLGARRDRLRGVDSAASEVGSAIAGLALMGWSSREAWHLGQVLLGIIPGSGVSAPTDAVSRLDALAATLTSGAWLVEAIVMLAIGWLRRSAFLRWCGLALLGITVIKFIVIDLQTVDVFWRFLTAIVVGAAMLALSYAYQRRRRPGTSGN